MTRTSLQFKPFFVVKFIELPSVLINDYVCVPYSWIITHRPTDDKVLVAYPKDVDALEIINLAKRRTKIASDWKVYSAKIIYESGTYKKAELWMTNGHGSELIEKEKSEIRGSKPGPVLGRKLRSFNHSPCSSLKPDKSQLTVKPFIKPRPFKVNISPKVWKQLATKEKLEKKIYTKTARVPENFNVKIVKERTQPVPAAANKSSTKADLSISNQLISSKPVQKPFLKIHEDRKCELRSMPIIDVNESTEFAKTNQGVQSSSGTEQKPSSTETSPSIVEQFWQPQMLLKNGRLVLRNENQTQLSLVHKMSVGQSAEQYLNNQETHLHSVSNTAPKSRDSANQHYFGINSNLYSNNQQKDIEVRRSTECTSDGQEPLSHDITDKMPSISCYLPTSLQLSTQLHEERKKPTLSIIKKPNNEKNYLQTKTKKYSTAIKNSSKSIIQSKLLIQPAVSELFSPIIQSHGQEILQGSVMSAGKNNERNGNNTNFALQGIGNTLQENQRGSEVNARRSNKANSMDNKAFHEDIEYNTSATHQQTYFVKKSHAKQYLPTQEKDLQRFTDVKDIVSKSKRTQTSGPFALQNRVNVSDKLKLSIESLKKKLLQRRPNHQDSKRDTDTLRPRVGINFKSNRESQKPGPQSVTKKIPPPFLSDFPKVLAESLLTPHRNYAHVQAKQTEGATVEDQMHRTSVPRNSMMERVKQNIYAKTASSSEQTQDSQFTPVKKIHAYQNLRTKKVVVDRSNETDFLMNCIHIDDKTPAEKVNFDCTDETIVPNKNTQNMPTALQNLETLAERQMNLRNTAEQQMLNEFGTLFTQFGTGLFQTRDMFNNLRNSITECSETYKRLFELVQIINATGNLQIAIPKMAKEEKTRDKKR